MRRIPFLLTVALIAAAIGDPLVESIANTGVVGAGYADDNHLGVLPALLVGVLLLLGVVTVRGIAAWCGRTSAPIRAGDVTFAETLRLLPWVLIVQLALVFFIECAEGMIARGSLPAGLAWLGGPLLLSLGIHAAIASLCAAACTAAVRWAVGSVVALISDAVHFIRVCAERVRTAADALERGDTPLNVSAPPVRQIGGRAPPRPLRLNAR